MITSRRTFLTGLGAALITAPAIVRAGSLMPVKAMVSEGIMLTVIPHPERFPVEIRGIDAFGREAIETIWIDPRSAGGRATLGGFRLITGIEARP